MSDCDQIPVTKLLCVMNHVARSPHGNFFFCNFVYRTKTEKSHKNQMVVTFLCCAKTG